MPSELAINLDLKISPLSKASLHRRPSDDAIGIIDDAIRINRKRRDASPDASVAAQHA